jgi:hypothetical protein
MEAAIRERGYHAVESHACWVSSQQAWDPITEREGVSLKTRAARVTASQSLMEEFMDRGQSLPENESTVQVPRHPFFDVQRWKVVGDVFVVPWIAIEEVWF